MFVCGLIMGNVPDGEYHHFYELNEAEGPGAPLFSWLNETVTVTVVK